MGGFSRWAAQMTGAVFRQNSTPRTWNEEHPMTETATFIKDTATVRNGVVTTTMFATLDAIKDRPEIAKFQSRTSNSWLGGAHNRSTIKDFYAACGEDTPRQETFVLDAGEPAILLRSDTGPNPAEYLLHAL